MSIKQPNMARAASLARLLSAWILAWLTMTAAQAAAPVPSARNLADDAHVMQRNQLPLMLLFSRADCPWCERLRREQLAGIAAESAPRVLLREVAVDADTPLTDFQGAATTHRAFAAAHGAKLAPTLMFFGPSGQTLTEPLVGYQTPDFFSALIDRAIDNSRERMHNTKP